MVRAVAHPRRARGRASPDRLSMSEPQEGGSPSLQVLERTAAGLGVQGDFQRLGALGPPEPDDRSLEVHVFDPQQPDAAVASRPGDQDRDDRAISQIERTIPGTASFQSP